MNFVRYASWMQERGWKVIVFCVENSNIHQRAISESVEVVNIKRNGKYFDLMNAFRVKRMFQKHEISVCWFRDTRDFSLLGLVKRISGSNFKLMYQQAMQFGVSKKDFFHTQRFKPVDAWISTLHFLADQVRSMTHFPQSRIHVIPLGVDVSLMKKNAIGPDASRMKFDLPSEIRLLGMIGRLDPLKGQHVAIEALYLLHQRGQQCHLLICGESTLHEGAEYGIHLHSLVNKYKLESFVHFRPFSQEVQNFYEAIDIFVLCSKGETFGTVTIEAMAFEKPIVATRSSGTPEILQQGECGILFDPGNAMELADALQTFLLSEEFCKQMGQKAEAVFSSHYSKEISIRKMEDIVTSLLTSSEKD